MSAVERKLRGLKNRKRSIITSFTCITSFVNNFQAERDAIEVPVRLENFVALWNEFNEVQAELESMEESEETMESYLKERTEFEKAYYRVKGKLLLYNKPNTDPQDSQHRLQEPSSHMPHIKLPDVRLPVFSGDFETWLNFHDLFLSLVHSSAHLSTIQKFYYLRSSLAGEALKLIQTIPICNEQYPVAWKMLEDHFSNPRRLKRTYVQSLFDFPCMKRETASELHSLIEKFEANVKICKQLGERTEHWDVLLIHLLSTRLDTVTRRDWEEYAEMNQTTKFSQLIEFLQRRVNVLQTVVYKSGETQQQPSAVKKPVMQRSGYYGSVQGNSSGCIACSGPHSLYQCETFSNYATHEKEQFVRRNQLCRNCLRRGHMAKDCSSESSCRKCRGRHHTQLCTIQRTERSSQAASIPSQLEHSNPTTLPTNQGIVSSTPAAHTGVTSCKAHGEGTSKILLATAIIILIDDNGHEHPVRALLDSGSECCFASERVSQRMAVRRNKVDLPIAGIGQSSTQVRFKFRSTLKSRITAYTDEVDLFVLPKVTIELPSLAINTSSWAIPTGIQLADPSFYEPVAGRIPLGNSSPCLVNSVFGWVVSGRTALATDHTSVTCNVATMSDIHRSMERFWTIEDDTSPAYSPQETFCEQYFRDTVTRDTDGRYCVRLPLKRENLNNLGDNKITAFHRFRLIERRLSRDVKLADEYRGFMEEYVQLGHMKLISEAQAEIQPSFFLPHHPVIREESSTTKVRVVFDGSCKSATGLSLNDVMLVGPIIQEDLRSIVMRSRLHPIMLIADVAKMFRQIRLHPEDTPLQRIFWRFSPSEPVSMYELKTVTYGTASAPYLATRVLQQLANDEQQNYPVAAKATSEDFYVDDFLSGAKTVEEAVELRVQMEAMFDSAGLKLRKWASNSSAALMDVPEEDRALQQTIEFSMDQTIKSLGLHWEPHTDRLKYRIETPCFEPSKTVTKRSALSCIAKLFDPLGLVSPVVVTAKIFMQALWSLKGENGKPIDWDRELPEPMRERWTSYYSQLPLLSELRIERIILIPNAIAVELHFFSDASERAVSKIQHATQNCEWNHIAGSENPADIVSRGLPANDLLESKLWWQGSPWLIQQRESWPVQVLGMVDRSEILKEERKTALVAAPATPSFIEEFVAKFSDYQHMLRVTAYCRRFVNNVRDKIV
ncbi:uncharacterized protein LOC131693727 [Topomyia yanbarensis]|uniref:uncharacterized protein LOC131693727 n=1 Tax=Topomyia yanbarensis TaxID=2498891 RepID=UPI00273BCC9C|nr:uncharacterized protein LOC131693727 [Topomyia yanbarensis]